MTKWLLRGSWWIGIDRFPYTLIFYGMRAWHGAW